MSAPLLEIEGLKVRYRTRQGDVHAVDDVSLTIAPGEAFGIAGESGSGKSTLVRALLRLLPRDATVEARTLRFQGRDLLATDDRTFRKAVLWRALSLVPQSAQNSLNPAYRVDDQIVEALQAHAPIGRRAALDRVAVLFDVVGLQPELMRRYPHELSGGMRQRVMIAMALAFEPALIVMDEPTTGLDVLVQERLLRRIAEIRERVGCAILLITHDIAVIAELADRIGIMYAGRLVEAGPAQAIFKRAAHPYTLGLQNAFPNIRTPARELISIRGSPPPLSAPSAGCGFAPRCPFVLPACSNSRPPERTVGEAHRSACLRVDEMGALRPKASEKATWRS